MHSFVHVSLEFMFKKLLMLIASFLIVGKLMFDVLFDETLESCDRDTCVVRDKQLPM